MSDTYEEEDPALAAVMEKATGHLRKLLPPDVYRELRYDVGLMVDLHPETGAVLESLRHQDRRVETSGPVRDEPAKEGSKSA